MRHAKSSWQTEATSDHDRPLNHRGNEEAPRVAQRLQELGWRPELVLSSDSLRTRETFQHLAEVWNPVVPVEFSRTLYLGGYDELLQEVSGVSEAVTSLMVLGHNPGCEQVVQQLTGEFVVMKTASAALLLGPNDDDWSTSLRHRGQWQLVDVVRGR
jgi:phosphohistidine phosphatase